jgi:hypothetical protein
MFLLHRDHNEARELRSTALRVSVPLEVPLVQRGGQVPDDPVALRHPPTGIVEGRHVAF